MGATGQTATGRIGELESALADLRLRLEAVTFELAQDTANTSLVIRRVNVMKQIMVAQSELDALRAKLASG